VLLRPKCYYHLLHMVDVKGQYQKIKPEIDAAAQDVIDSGQLILGKEIGELECDIAGAVSV